ncbi:hypothetical protein PMAYCL1PPCAC_13903, partial [Pristionchus mayeri]
QQHNITINRSTVQIPAVESSGKVVLQFIEKRVHMCSSIIHGAHSEILIVKGIDQQQLISRPLYHTSISQVDLDLSKVPLRVVLNQLFGQVGSPDIRLIRRVERRDSTLVIPVILSDLSPMECT